MPLSLPLLLLAACAPHIRSAPPATATPLAAAAAAPAASPAPFIGTWIHAQDPNGRIPVDPVYVDSTLTLGGDGRYVFQLAGTTFALEGTWALTSAAGDASRIHTDYGEGRQNDLTLTLRRSATGAVIGMEVREGDGTSGARYYVPLPDGDGQPPR